MPRFKLTQQVPLFPDGYAPFLSMTSRDNIFRVSGTLLSSPGPAYYDGFQMQNRVPGGQSLQNKALRFKESKEDKPGPGIYIPISDFDEIQKKPKMCRLLKKPKSIVIPDAHMPTAPSIPSSNQSYGYEETKVGILCRKPPPARDLTLGPAFYYPQFLEAQSTRKYKGVQFGKSTSKREGFKIRPGPGPGAYDIDGEKQFQCENLNLKNEEPPRCEVFIPRYLESVMEEEIKKDFPGPGKYEIRRQFDDSTCPPCGIVCGQPPFLSQTKRFEAVKSITPAPGAYNDPRTALQSLKRLSGKQNSPFGLTAARFVPDFRSMSEPGPASYNISHYSLARSALKKAFEFSSIRGGFGSSAPRMHSLLTKQDLVIPGPAHYQVKDKKEEAFKSRHSSSFASVSDRLPLHNKQLLDIPSPGAYDVHGAFDRMQGRGPCFLEDTKCASFMSTEPRELKIGLGSQGIPGPNVYYPEVKIKPKLGLISSIQPRFKDIVQSTPGPGAYKLSSSVMDTVLKGTFNATLQNPLLNQPESPRQTEPKMSLPAPLQA
uniref:Sperm-tail PG-rich repeat-containing protein 2 n=1 Tax=Callorhinchus milii TaxID=7868 RepID=A0A4W3ICG9_CALMI